MEMEWGDMIVNVKKNIYEIDLYWSNLLEYLVEMMGICFEIVPPQFTTSKKLHSFHVRMTHTENSSEENSWGFLVLMITIKEGEIV